MIKVYYIAEADFSVDDASTSRVIHNALSIIANNKFHVTIIGYGDIPQIIKKDFIIKHVKRGESSFCKVLHFVSRGFSIVNLLRKENHKPGIIIYYGVYSRILLPLMIYCRKNDIKIITDIAEWFDYSHLAMGRFGLIACDAHFSITRLIQKCDGVIAISSFLESYYKEKGVYTIRVPVTVDTSEGKLQDKPDRGFDPKYLNLIYAGSPGKKELLVNIIRAVQEVNKEDIHVKFHLLGPEVSDIKKKCPDLDNEVIICHGRVHKDQVTAYLEQADFSVLLRPQKRFAQAGFPTKFVDSLNAGLPVIANLTSNLFEYLIDEVNGFVVSDTSVNALKSTLRRIIKIQKPQLEKMRENARETAINNFDYRLFSRGLEIFMTKIIYS